MSLFRMNTFIWMCMCCTSISVSNPSTVYHISQTDTALMPEGDHINIIDPPGLTVMRIAGGRYRCTAAHRVVWTWNSEFPPGLFSSPPKDGPPGADVPSSPMDELHMGDLVTMTIVDVFETDTDGRLLSYCPTFDNRAIRKTMKTAEQLRKGGSKVKAVAKVVAKSHAAARFNSVSRVEMRLFDIARLINCKVPGMMACHIGSLSVWLKTT